MAIHRRIAAGCAFVAAATVASAVGIGAAPAHAATPTSVFFSYRGQQCRVDSDGTVGCDLYRNLILMGIPFIRQVVINEYGVDPTDGIYPIFTDRSKAREIHGRITNGKASCAVIRTGGLRCDARNHNFVLKYPHLIIDGFIGQKWPILIAPPGS